MKPYFSSFGRLMGRLAAVLPLLLLQLLARPGLAQPTILSTVPARNANTAARATNVAVTFSQAMGAASNSALRVFSAQYGGRKAGPPASVAGSTVTFNPTTSFKAGETVWATVRTTAENSGGVNLAAPRVFQFTTATTPSTGAFNGGTDVALPNFISDLALGDVSNDGRLDAVGVIPYSDIIRVLLSTGDGNFGATADLTMNDPDHVALADVNGDGDLDVVATSRTQGTLFVFTNIGGAAFLPGVATAVGNSPTNLALGDVDGDGDLDLAVTDSGDNMVRVRLNNGNGSFAGGSTFALGNNPGNIKLGDVDNDGDLDMLATNNDAVQVRFNNGSGSYGGGSTIPLTYGLSDLALGDVDGDGDLDLATVSFGANTLSVCRNLGGGSFGAATTLPTGNASLEVAMGDIDGDGDLDLVLTNLNDNNAEVKLNNGAGGFSQGATTTVGSHPQALALGDVDDDGDLDVVTGNGNSTMSVRLNEEDFVVLSTTPASNQRNAPRSNDVALTFNLPVDNATAGNVRVFGAQAGGKKLGAYSANAKVLTFNPAVDFRPGELVSVSVPGTVASSGGLAAERHVHQFLAAATGGTGIFSGGSNPGINGGGNSATVTGDVDGDGLLDLIIIKPGADEALMKLGNGDGTFAAGLALPMGDDPQKAALADVDSDGDLDLLVTNHDANTVRVLANNGSGVFSLLSDVPVGSAPQGLAVGDVDGDGDLDFATANTVSSNVSIRFNNGSGSFAGVGSVGVGTGPYDVVLADLDGDGDLDLLATNRSDNTVSIRFNSGSGSFGGGSSVSVGVAPDGLAVGDVDGDGDLDLVTANVQNSSNTASLRLNNGSGVFGGGTEVVVGDAPADVALGDVDGDGDLDLVTANSGDGTATVKLNNGVGVFAGGSTVPATLNPYSIVLADVDNDGDLDLLMSIYTAVSGFVRLNQDAFFVTSVSPARDLRNAPRASDVVLTFNKNINNGTANRIRVFGQQLEGKKNGAYSAAANTLTFNPTQGFKPGERVSVSVPTTVLSSGANQPARHHVYQFTAAAGVGPGTFAAGPDGPANDGAGSLALADVNGDGALDLFASNTTAGNVSLYLGGNDGTFGPGTVLGTGMQSIPGMSTGDVDGDGDLDLMLAATNEHELRWYLNNGSGTFGPANVLTVPGTLYGFALGDVDGDNDLDVLTGYGIYLNIGGSLSFGSNITLAVAGGVTLGDVDADGDLDAVSPGSIRFNNGAGQFGGGYNFNTIDGAKYARLGDLDGDGDLDLVVGNANFSNSNVWVRLNDGLGIFSDPLVLPTPASRCNETVLADADGDGDLDILVDGFKMSLLRNNGNATFGPAELTPTYLSYYLAVGDLDNDGDLDFVTDGPSSYLVRLNEDPLVITALSPTRNLRNAPAASSVAITFNKAMSNAPASVAGVKVYGSQRGRLNTAGTATANGPTITFDPAAAFKPGEIIYAAVTTAVASSANTHLAEPHGYQFTAAAGAGPGTFAAGSEVSVGPSPRKVATGDVDGDGDLDLVTNSDNNITDIVSVRLNNGSGSFSGGTDVPVGQLPYGLELVDVDGDGDLDLLTASFTGTLETYFNNGSGSFSAGPTLALTNPFELTTADVDGDGDLDALATRVGSADIYVCVNNGSGTFSLGTTLTLQGSVTTLATGDVDGDGDVDIAVGGVNQMYLLLNQGNGLAYDTALPLALASFPAEMRLADLDGDGDLDLGIAAGGNVYLRFNNGSGLFGGNTSLGLSAAYHLVFGDVDGDGDLDALAGERNLNLVHVHRNNGSGAFSGSYTAFVSKPSYLALGDLDGDLDLDLLVASADNNQVSVRFNEVPLAITSLSPTRNLRNATAGSSVAVTFSEPISAAPASVASVQVFSAQRGGRLNNADGVASANGSTITFDPTTNFKAGETIWTTVTTAATSSANPAIHLNEGHVHQFTAAATGGSAIFANAPDVPTGILPNAVATADLNGDGNLDIIVSNATSNTVSRHLGNGNGTFGAAILVNANITGCTYVVAADVDGDGDLDLLLVDRDPGMVRVHKNNGTGTFGAASSVSMGTTPLSLAVADLDGDGDLDFVVNNQNSMLISVRYNDGNGTFSGAGGVNLGSAASRMALGDMDGDGRVDIVGTGAGVAKVMRNLGAGQFSLLSTVTVGSNPNLVLLGDLDGDGDLDLVTPNEVSSNASVRFNNGAGQLSGVVNYATSADTFLGALGDLDGDGDLDLVVADGRTDNTSTVLLNNGNGTFAAGTPMATPTGFALALGDLDNDGDLDALVTNETANLVSVRLNQAVPPVITALSPTRNRRNAAVASSVAITFDQPMSGAAASTSAVKVFSQQRGGKVAGTASAAGNTITFNPTNDFRPGETVYATITTDAQSSAASNLAKPHVYQFTAATTGGTGTFVPGSDLASGNFALSSAVGDADGDGDLDIVCTLLDGTVKIWLNSGNAGYTLAPLAPGLVGATSMVLGDMDGDSDLDMVLTDSNAGNTIIRFNNGTGTFSGGVPLNSGANYTRMALGDVDGDGDLDLALAGGLSGSLSLYFNNGNGTFGPASNTSISSGASALALGDMDGDGDLDLVIASYTANNVSLHFNNGSGTFGPALTVSVAANPSDLALGDLDGDGDLDLVTSCEGANNASVRRNNGNGTFSGNSNPALPNGSRNVELSDVDGDGDLDLLTTSVNNNDGVSLCRNNGNGTFGSSAATSLMGNLYTLVMGDLDGDGDLDFVTNDIDNELVYVRLNAAATLPDLIVSTVTPVTGGPYNNVTVTSTGVGTLGANLSVAGTLRIEDGGVLNDGCFTITGPGSFVLEAGGTLGICSPQGIALAGATGTVQVAGSRSFSADASYVYNGTALQITGTGLPAATRNLTANNPAHVRLDADVSVRRILTVGAGNLLLGASNLLLPSDASGTAMVVNSGVGVVQNNGAGRATMQRHITVDAQQPYAGAGYRHYASPMQSNQVGDLAVAGQFVPLVNPAYNALPTPGLPLAEFPNVFDYQQNRLTNTFDSFDTGWHSPAALTDPLTGTTGYTVHIAPAAKVALTGTLNNGDLNTGPLNRGAGLEAGWHLLGNPYPAPFDWAQVTAQPGALPAGLADAIYVFEPTAAYAGFYRSFVNGIGTQGFTGLLPAMQGFFVRATQNVPAGFTFRNGFRLMEYANPAFQRQTSDPRPTLRLTLGGLSGGTDETVVYLQTGATALGLDARYDAVKVPNPGAVVSLGSQMAGAGNEPLAINGLPLLVGSSPATVVPLTLRVPAAGSYHFTIAALENFDPSLSITLLDRALNTRTNLRLTSTYAFSAATAGPLNGRFEVLLGVAGTATATTAGQALAFSVWPNPATGQAALHIGLMQPAASATVVLYNVLGQEVRRHAFAGAGTELPTIGLAAGTYLLTLQVPGQAPATRRVVVE